MKTKRLLLAAIALASLVYLAGLVYYAQVRPIDPDEGYYPTAARLVWEGQTPYRDFSYPQGPLLPYVYSWVWAVHPRSLVAMRFLSAACGGIAIFLWGVCLIFAKPLSPKTALATFRCCASESLLGVVECRGEDLCPGEPPDVHRHDQPLRRPAIGASQVVLYRRHGHGRMRVRAHALRAISALCLGMAAPPGMAHVQAALP